MPLLDPERLQDAVPGLLGGLVTGFYHFGAVVIAGGVPDRADCARLAVNLMMSVVVGALFAYFWTAAFTRWMPIAAFKDASAIGFGIGLLGWELLPLLYLVARNRARGQGTAP